MAAHVLFCHHPLADRHSVRHLFLPLCKASHAHSVQRDGRKKHVHHRHRFPANALEGNYKYTYNNGHLAMADPIAAARNFLNALERIPTIIDQYKSKNEVLEKEIPQLQEIAGKVWKKDLLVNG